MPLPVWSVGQVLSAADVNAWFVPLAVIKPAGQTVTSSTAFVNDNALVLAMTANASYHIEAIIEYNAAGGGDIKWTFAIPAGANGFYGLSVTNVSSQYVGGAAFVWTDTYQGQGAGTGTPLTIRISGIINIVSAGNLQFRWAQNTSSGTATTVMGNSALIAQRIG